MLRSVLDLPIADSCWFPCIHHHQGRGDVYVCEGEPWPPVCLLSQFSFLQLPDVWTQSVLPHRYLQAVHRAPALHSGWSLLKTTLSASPGM